MDNPTQDAYMEWSDPAVWGETYDAQFGMGEVGRKLGAFEIASFTFNAKPDKEGKDGPKGQASIAEPTVGQFTVKKYIDKASPDLFVTCLKKKPIEWGIISVRETGEDVDEGKRPRTPYLVLEFRKLTVDSFDWNLNPGDPGSANTTETIAFSFETILIKYSRQERSGEHRIVKIKGWDREHHTDEVTPLDTTLQASARE